MPDPVPLHEPHLRAVLRHALERDGVARRAESGATVTPELWIALVRGVARDLEVRVEVRRTGDVVEAVVPGHRPPEEPETSDAFREHQMGWLD